MQLAWCGRWRGRFAQPWRDTQPWCGVEALHSTLSCRRTAPLLLKAGKQSSLRHRDARPFPVPCWPPLHMVAWGAEVIRTPARSIWVAIDPSATMYPHAPACQCQPRCGHHAAAVRSSHTTRAKQAANVRSSEAASRGQGFLRFSRTPALQCPEPSSFLSRVRR